MKTVIAKSPKFLCGILKRTSHMASINPPGGSYIPLELNIGGGQIWNLN